MEFNYPESMDPRFDTEPVPFKCLECEQWLPLEEMSETFGVCHECFVLERIQNLMRRKRKSLINDFGNLMAEMHKQPEWDAMIIKKI